MKFSFLSISSLIIYLFPAALISGPFVSDLIVSTLSIVFIVYSIIKKLFDYFKNIFFYSFLIFWLICILSSFFSQQFFFSIINSLFFIRFGIFSILIYYLVKKNPNFIKNFYYTTLCTLIILLTDAYFQKFFGVNITGNIPVTISKIHGLFGKEEILGTYLLRITPILLFICLLQKKNINYFLIFFYIFVEPIIFYSGQRSIFYMSLIYILFLILFIKHNRKSIVALIFLIIFLSYNLFLNKNYNYRMIKDITDNYQIFKPYNYDVDGKYKYLKFMFYSPNQTILWITSLNIFMDNKVIGAGPNTFRYICDKYKPKVDNEYNKCSTHPHNFAFQLLAETGLIGFLIYLYFYLFLLKKIMINLYRKIFYQEVKNLPHSALIILILINFFPLITNGNFFNNYLSIINFLPFGLILFLANKK
jgi:O-antigen ligase